MKKIIALAAVVILVITACEKDKGAWYSKNWEKEHPNGQVSGTPVPCDTAGVISYSTTIQPIVASNCATTASCHISHGGAGASNYNVFANVQTDGIAGTFMQRIRLSTTNSLHMPQAGGFLPTCDTMKINKWIAQGCLNN